MLRIIIKYVLGVLAFFAVTLVLCSILEAGFEREDMAYCEAYPEAQKCYNFGYNH